MIPVDGDFRDTQAAPLSQEQDLDVEAEALDPEDLSVLYNYGKFYQAMDMHYPAVRALRRYIDKDQASQWAEEAAYDLAKLTAP